MVSKWISISALSLGLWCGSALAGTPQAGESEADLGQALAAATWPADISRLAGLYLDRYPQAAGADAARRLQQQAATPETILQRSDVRLYRRAFAVSASTPPELSSDIHQAALGDHAAAMRVAQSHRLGERGAAKDAKLSLGWLQYAAVLGNDQAAYDLAVYFRQQDQPAVASRYEALAVALNHPLPTVLDHVRK
ncbi:MAG: hypothetical protein EOP38_02695 [Rubrivivax sp.]|nr:MAG: hypothetical protein EOP38_02695 [Rubrivivax sp.]